jgi:nucleotidyltransferase substrate binding protein (TIGR01987 family)
LRNAKIQSKLMTLNTDHLRNTLRALESAVALYQHAAAESEEIDQEIFRMAIVKGFELTQEVCFKLIKRRLKDFGQGGRKLEATPVKELLRLAAQHGLLTLEEVERWFAYRYNRNDTAHDYGEAFAEETLALMPDFIRDARGLEARLLAGNADFGGPA